MKTFASFSAVNGPGLAIISMSSSINYRLLARRALGMTAGLVKQRSCICCGKSGWWFKRKVLWPTLISEWELSSRNVALLDERDGRRCHWCGMALRHQILMSAIIRVFSEKLPEPANSFMELVGKQSFRLLRIAEINSAGDMHQTLKNLPHLHYSEYGSKNSAIRSEDITALSYADDFFDLVITSDTLEHVPDVRTALAETRRILKPGGYHIFTTPVLWDRPLTKTRARISSGSLEHLAKPSYHGDRQNRNEDYLVFHEFGADFVELAKNAGFEMDVMADPSNPLNVAFIARKPFVKNH